MIKIIGGIFVIFASFSFFYNYSRKYARRLSELEELSLMLAMLDSEIFYSLNPFPVAFANISRGRGAAGDIFFFAAEYMKKKEYTDMAGVFTQAINEARGKLHLKAEDFIIIEDFSKGLVSADVTGQRSNINAAREKIAYQISGAREDSKKFTKLYTYLGILSGVTVVILLF